MSSFARCLVAVSAAALVTIAAAPQPAQAAAKMVAFSRNILLLSLLISAITATLVYLSLHYLFVRPLNRLTTNMVSFRQDPENASHIVVPSKRTDEIGIAERELAAR